MRIINMFVWATVFWYLTTSWSAWDLTWVTDAGAMDVITRLVILLWWGACALVSWVAHDMYRQSKP